MSLRKGSDQFFNDLAYVGIKNYKAQKLEQLKIAQELASCTFTPNTYGSSPKTKVSQQNFEKLSKNTKSQNVKIYDKKKEALELRNCTFKPNIDKKSSNIADKNRGLSSNKSYEVLFSKHNTRMDKMKKLVEEKEKKEVAECTFAPALIKKNSK